LAIKQVISIGKLNYNNVNTTKIVTYREINNKTIDEFVACLSCMDWSSLDDLSAADACTAFHGVLCHLFNSIMPEKQRKVKPYSKKYQHSEEIQKIRSILDAIYVIKMKKGDELSDRIYKLYKEIYKQKVEEYKKSENEKIIQSSINKQQAIWKVINKEQKSKNKKELNPNCHLTSDDMNTFFCTIGPETTQKISHTATRSWDLLKGMKPCGSSLYFVPTDNNEVLKTIKSLKNKDTKDIYGLSTKVLKQINEEIAYPITILINKCMEEGVFPNELKVAVVTPIHKEGDIDTCANYRPISVLPTISKVFEAVIRDRLVKYFEGFGLFSNSQNGYRKNRSTATALLQQIEIIKKSIDNHQPVQIAACDLSKAFDTMSHSDLLNKLEFYGVRGVPYKLLESYLQDRSQIVKWNGEASTRMPINYGVPQGSILGPLLFIIYTNDLSINVTNCQACIQYADDTSFLITGKTNEEMASNTEETLKEAKQWFDANKLKINENKTQKLAFSLKNNAEIAAIKFLGIYVDSRLNWSIHVQHLNKKLATAIYMIHRTKKFATYQCAKTAYYAGFHSRFYYGIQVWGASSAAREVFILQKRAIRALCGLRPNESCREYFKKEEILTVAAVYILTCVKHVHQNKDNFSQNNDHHNHDTRYRNQLQIPYHRVTTTQQGVGYWGIKCYNHLPEHIKVLPPGLFESTVKELLSGAVVYTIEEFLNMKL